MENDNNKNNKLPTDSLTAQLYKVTKQKKKIEIPPAVKIALAKEEFFIDLSRKEIIDFLRAAPLGTFLFGLSSTVAMTLDFCLVGINGIKTTQWEIIYNENKLSFKWNDKQYKSLTELINKMKTYYISILTNDVNTEVAAVNNSLEISEKNLPLSLSQIKTQANSLLGDNLEELRSNLSKLNTESENIQKLTYKINILQQTKQELEVLQKNIANETQALLQSYLDWKKPYFLKPEMSQEFIFMPLRAYVRILENLYFHYMPNKDIKLAGIDIKHIPCVIEAARLFKIDVRNNVPQVMAYIEQNIKVKPETLLQKGANELAEYFKSKEQSVSQTHCALM